MDAMVTGTIIFLDTEFTDFLNIDLISVGLVSEDGQHEFYAERTDYDQALCNPIVQSNLLPMLGQTPGASMTADELNERLHSWFGGLPPRVVVACDSPYDWELLLDALGNRVPPNIKGWRDLRPLAATPVYHKAVLRYHEQPGAPWHHALHDARAHRAGWLAWVEANKGS